jgi:hypothetical protein
MTKRKRISVWLLLGVAACGAALTAPRLGGQAPAGQRRSPIPDTFTNLQVLPKDISKQELVNIMKNFCFTMDQRCSYCHVATDDLSSADFPADEKEPKKKARELLRLILAAKKTSASN